MAIKPNYLTVSVYGSSTTSLIGNGLQVSQTVDADGLGYVDFKVDGRALGWDYDGGTTDRVELIDQDTGDVVALTRAGDYFRWTMNPDDLRGAGVEPGSTFSRSCRIVVTRTTGGDTASNAPGRWESEAFTVTVDRGIGFSPDLISGLVLHLDAYDFIDTASSTAVSSWEDRSKYGRDVSQGTGANQPTVTFDGTGRPHLLFDGSNDELDTVWAQYGDPCTVIVAAQIDSADATTRGIVQVGGTGGVRIGFNSSNLKVLTGSDSQNTTLPSLDTPFVAAATKAASGDAKVQLNLNAQVTATSTQAVTDGTVQIGKTAADSAAAIRVYEVIVYDSVISAENIARVVRALMKKWGAV